MTPLAQINLIQKQFINEHKDYKNPRNDFLEALFNITSYASSRLSRESACKELIDIFSKTNTHISIPTEFISNFYPTEVETLITWFERLQRKAKRTSIKKYPFYWFETDDIQDLANSYMPTSGIEKKITKNLREI